MKNSLCRQNSVSKLQILERELWNASSMEQPGNYKTEENMSSQQGNMSHTVLPVSIHSPSQALFSWSPLKQVCLTSGEGCFLTWGAVAFLITRGVKQLLTCAVVSDSKPIKGTSCLRDRSSWPDCSAARGVLCAQDSKLRFQWPFTSKA